MAVREVLRYPHPALKEVARGADPADVQHVGADLVDTMRSFPRCVGIAAPQIGELVRIVAVDVTDHPKATTCHGLLVLANPRVVLASGSEVAPRSLRIGTTARGRLPFGERTGGTSGPTSPHRQSPRSRIALSTCPLDTSVRRKPCAIDSVITNTATTMAMPPAVIAAVPLRTSIERKL